MAKKGGSQTVTQRLDPATERMQQEIYRAARTAADASAGRVPGVDTLTRQAMQNFQGVAGLTNLGLGALRGDPTAFATLHNPFESQVLERMQDQYGDLLATTTNQINEAATRAGAFGGSRHGIAAGEAAADIARDQANQMAALLYQGFGDTMNRAGTLVNLGLGASDAMHNLGEYRRQVIQQTDPALRRLEILKAGISGVPSGTATTQPVNRNLAAGLLGGAATGAGIAKALGYTGAAGGPTGIVLTGLGGLLGLF